MAITAQRIVVYRGETATLNFALSTGEDITGWTLVFTVARNRDMVAKLFQLSASVVDGEAGTFTVALTPTHTNLLPDDYAWDVWRTNTGYEQVLAIGAFVVSGNVRIPTA
jgi:hypothetical protein